MSGQKLTLLIPRTMDKSYLIGAECMFFSMGQWIKGTILKWRGIAVTGTFEGENIFVVRDSNEMVRSLPGSAMVLV